MKPIPDSWGGDDHLREYNKCHSPAGSPEGGQFCSGEGGGVAGEEPGLRNRAESGEEWLKFRLVHAATRFDRRAAGRPGHNPYALPQYFEAIDAVMQRVKDGESVVSALDQEFTPGPLLRALKKVILPPIKDVEDERGGPPVNWDKGFQWPLQIGAGGKETPFLRDGTWKLRVWDGKRKKHYIYDYRTDMLEDDR